MAATQCPEAKVRWPVSIETGERTIDGVTHSLSSNVVFIKCPRPLRLNDTCDIVISSPNADQPLKARVEVVWSNVYGPDDDITPRGMGVRFLEISDDDRKRIAKEARQSLEQQKIRKRQLTNLETIVIDEDELGAQAS